MKIAIITGASSGMGREFVYALDQGAHISKNKSDKTRNHLSNLDEIWVIARREERLKDLQSTCKTKIRPIPLDLLVRDNFKKFQQLLITETPEVQLLINAAGFGLFGTFTELNMEEQLDIIELNAVALTAICHMTIPYMKKGSSIINLASNSSWQPVPYINVYGSSKAYVLNFSRALGVELKKTGIHVMAVAPGWIKTEFFDHAVQDDTIKYYDRFYTAEQVVEKAMKDLRKRKKVSILGFPVRMQVRAVKLLPVDLIMKIWCKQQQK